MPAVIPLAIAAGSAIGGIGAAKIASNAAGKSADIQTTAATHAADLEAKAAADALAFQKQQAETDWQNSQQTERANYDQWAAREGRMSGLGPLIGLPARNIPAYVPGIDPNFTSAPAQVPGGPPAAGLGATATSGDPIIDALIKNYQALGTAPTGPGSGPTDISYFADKIKQTGGLTPQNTAYWFGPQGRIAKEIAQASGGGAPAAAPMSFASFAANPTPTTMAPLTAPLAAPSPYSFASMVR
jgi:hypothetical protein